jgi:hypothetical protein
MSIAYDRLGPLMKALVSILVIVAFLGAIASLIIMSIRKEGDIAPGIKEILCILIGVLAGSFKDTVGYWLGSSHSSERKTEMLNASQAE